jgi:DNA processing protein
MTTTTNLTDTTWEMSGSRWDADTIARVAWSVIAQPGSNWVSALIAEHGATEALERALDISTNETLPCIPPPNRRSVARRTAQALQTTADCGYRLLSPSQEGWPSQLDAMADEAPLLLWVQGDAALLSSLTTVVTGTRAMSAHGLHMALELASGLADHGHTIVAGGEPGIDTAAHRAAIAMTGRTIAVIADGLDRMNAAGPAGLVAGVGAVVSEVPPGVGVRSSGVTRRNYVLGALGHSTVIVEAGLHSEVLGIAASAAAVGRGVGAAPRNSEGLGSVGCDHLLASGVALPVRTVGDAVRL